MSTLESDVDPTLKSDVDPTSDFNVTVDFIGILILKNFEKKNVSKQILVGFLLVEITLKSDVGSTSDFNVDTTDKSNHNSTLFQRWDLTLDQR